MDKLFAFYFIFFDPLPACQRSLGGTGQARLAALLPPAPLPRLLHPCLCQDLLEDGTAWVVCEGPPEDPGDERVGPSVAGDPSFDPKKVSLKDL